MFKQIIDDEFENPFSKTAKKQNGPLDKYEYNEIADITLIPKYEIFFSKENGFGIYSCEDLNQRHFSIQGTFINPLVLGQTYGARGKVTKYKNEKQLTVNTIKNVKPLGKKAIISYLKTLKGLKSRAEIIYNNFGDESIDILMKDPLIVSKTISGIGSKSVLDWKEQLENMKESQQAISTLLGYGLSGKQSKKLYEIYGDNIINKIESNPYFLAKEVKGFGFEKCDNIAKNIGFDLKSQYRIQEAIIYVLEKATNEGHCYLPKDLLIQRCIDLLNIKLSIDEMRTLKIEKSGLKTFEYKIGESSYTINYNDLSNKIMEYETENKSWKKKYKRYIVYSFSNAEVENQLNQIILQKRIINEDDNIYLYSYYIAEINVAEKIIDIFLNKKSFFKNVKNDLDTLLEEKKIELEDKQKEAVIEFSQCKGGFYILNGSAGCGKTFTLKIILELLQKQYDKVGEDFKVRVLAPTGKAAKVASRATGMECMTIHRGLKYSPELGFTYNRSNQLDADCIVIDESSMLDIKLTENLLDAITNETKVIFLGDTKQLPSVGAGNVLSDLIKSNIVNIITLTVIKRQGEESGIIRNANKIIIGEMIGTCNDTKDAYIIKRQSPKSVQDGIIDSIKRLLLRPDYSLDNIQVLCPQRDGSLGTYMFNYLLQKEFNSTDDVNKILRKKLKIKTENGETETIKLYFKKGDKVIHIKNNYDMDWYIKDEFGAYIKDKKTIGITNGECGIIESINLVKNNKEVYKRIIVRYEDKFVFYDDDFDELEHSYALTIHRSQGSQWKAIIMPIVKQHFNMLNNNLLYTAYTRAELFNVVIGQLEWIHYAIKNYKIRDRYTGLEKRIINYYESKKI